MRILAIDPGTTESGWALLDGHKVDASGVLPNADLLAQLKQCPLGSFASWPSIFGTFKVGAPQSIALAIEMVASYGMAVGREVFETCVWIGRFQQAWHDPQAVRLVYRKDVKMFLCGSPRAKDPNIRQALLDLLGPQGTKKAPGPTYGVKSHAWPALAVAVTVAQLQAARMAA